MIQDLSKKELEEFLDLSDFRIDYPNLMSQGDWDRFNELRRKRWDEE